VSVKEPSYAVNAGMAKQTEGHRLALSASPPSVRSLVGWLVGSLVKSQSRLAHPLTSKQHAWGLSVLEMETSRGNGNVRAAF
jgi:hypothetical protein